MEFLLQEEELFFDKALHVSLFQSAAAAPSPVMGNMPPNDGMPGGPMPPGFFQVRAALSFPHLPVQPPPLTLCVKLLPFFCPSPHPSFF